MSAGSGRGSFDDFLRWLTETGHESPAVSADPSAEMLEAARLARREFQALQSDYRQDLRGRLQSGGYFEEVELLAAADSNQGRWLPRLRTPNGFAISALYSPNSPPGAAPVGLLVECPVELIEVCRGQQVHVAAGGHWVELGEIDVDGKAMGDLPAGFEFKPPFGVRVGGWAEQPTELPKPPEPE